MEIKRFGRIREVIPLPPLTEIQVESYRRALQADVPPEKRENVGIQDYGIRDQRIVDNANL